MYAVDDTGGRRLATAAEGAAFRAEREAKHTPGPWDTDGDVQANARLIASAPHLLQVLDMVAVALEDYYAGMSEWDDGLLATVRAALAKATA